MERPPSTPVQRRSLVESTIDAIRSMVEQRVWKVGDCIPRESELVEQFQVGRNTVREAVRVLSHSGMLEVRQGDGTYVRRDLDPAETVSKLNRSGLRDHLELQCLLESEAARFAARRRTPEDIAALNGALQARGDYSPEVNLDEFLANDRDFHVAIATASHNEALQALYAYFTASIHNHTKRIFADADLPEPSLRDHQAIVEAIVAGDEEGAANAARSMLTPMIDTLDAQLGSKPVNKQWMNRIGATFWK
jgi:DNA-binding FadR family transcriptional regulator